MIQNNELENIWNMLKMYYYFFIKLKQYRWNGYFKCVEGVLGWRLSLANVLGWKTCTNIMGDT